jgi:hypothetical protein
MTSYPSAFKMAAVVELSTPPLMATATRPFAPGNIDSSKPFTAEIAENAEKNRNSKMMKS